MVITTLPNLSFLQIPYSNNAAIYLAAVSSLPVTALVWAKDCIAGNNDWLVVGCCANKNRGNTRNGIIFFIIYLLIAASGK